jgi:basic membrane lipoprotein Med (substrate-binding protein (PBP1-ABC) superfamily)
MRTNSRTILVAGLIAAALVACGKTGTPTPAAGTPTAESLPSPTATVEPFLLLMAPDPPKSSAGAAAVTAIEAFAREQSWPVRRVTPGAAGLAAEALGSPQLVAAVESGFGSAVAAAAQARADVRFVAVEEAGAQPLANLLVIGGEYVRRDEAAFMAGLLAGVENNNDYVGWIGEDGTARGAVYRNGFRHGIRYACPRCRLFDFELAASAGAAAGTDAADQLLSDYVDTASAIPGAAGAAGLARLAQSGVRVAGAGPDFHRDVFGGGAGPGAKFAIGEPAFRPDLLLADLLPRYMGGETFSEAIAYSLENGGLEYGPFPNDRVSPARQTYLKEILAEVAAGRLDIGVDPQTGAEK